MAASKTIANLGIAITARTKGLRKGLDNAAKRVQKFGSDLGKAAGQIAAIGAGIAALATGGLTVAFVKTSKSIDGVVKTARKLGLAPDVLLALHDAAEISGVSIETMNTSLQRMVRRVSEAGKGTGEAQGAIKELGLNAQNLAKLSPEAQFTKIGNALRKFPKGDQIRLAMKVFDTEGVGLVNTFDELNKLGGQGVGSGIISLLDQLQAKGRDIGELGKPVEELRDVFRSLTEWVSGFATSLTTEAAPGINAFLKALEVFTGGTGIGGAIKATGEELGRFIGQLAFQGGRTILDPGMWADTMKSVDRFVTSLENIPRAFDDLVLTFKIIDQVWETTKSGIAAVRDIIVETIELIARLAAIAASAIEKTIGTFMSNMMPAIEAFRNGNLGEAAVEYIKGGARNFTDVANVVTGKSEAAQGFVSLSKQALDEFANKTEKGGRDLTELGAAIVKALREGLAEKDEDVLRVKIAG